MIKTQSPWTIQISTRNTTQSIGQGVEMVECSFTNYMAVGSCPVAVT